MRKFDKSFNGYNVDQVNSFVDDVVDKVEKEIAEEQPVANAPQDFDIIDAKVEEPKPTPAPAPEKSADDEEETPF